MHYPEKFSNDPRNTDILRDLSLLNQPAGCLEWVNTKDEETFTMAYKTGSFDRFFKDGKESLVIRDKRAHITGDEFFHVQGNQTNLLDQNKETIILGDVHTKIGDVDKWQKFVEQYKAELQTYHNDVRKFEVQRTNTENSIDQASGQTKSGSHATCPVHSTKSKVLTTSNASSFNSSSGANKCRPLQTIKKTSDGYKTISGGGPNGACFTCGGSLLSPSSQDGSFSPDPAKAALISKRAQLQKKLYEFEKHLGQNKNPNGGSNFLTIAKDYILNIGLALNDLESYRRDPVGKLVPAGVKIDPKGTNLYVQYKESPLVEAVDVERLPGGSWEILANNNFNLIAGSGGISMKTTGQMQLGGTMFTAAMENILLTSRSELSLVAKRIDLNADIISFRPNEFTGKGGTSGSTEQQLLIDGNFMVSMNTILKGGLHAEGEVTLHHITAPLEWHTTESDFELAVQEEPKGIIPDQDCPKVLKGLPVKKSPPDMSGNTKGTTYGDILPGALLGYAIGKDSNNDTHCLEVWSIDSPNVVCMHPHYHNFPSLPMTLIGDGEVHDKVRQAGADNNYAVPVVANKVNDVLSPLSTSEGKKVPEKEKGTKDILPKGEGVRTSNYTSDKTQKKLKDLEKKVEKQYNQLKKDLANLSSLNFSINIDNSGENPIITGNSPSSCL